MELRSIFDELNLVFDDNGNTTISRSKLTSLVKTVMQANVFSEDKVLPMECYVLVDKNLADFYLVMSNELENWESDNSCESGDLLFKMQRLKVY